MKSRVWFVLILQLLVQTPAFAVPAPEFSQADIRGEMQSVGKYKGKYLVLYFWASWCGACRKETPSVIQIYRKYHPQGIEFLSVSLDQKLDRLESFVDKERIPYPTLFDGKGWGNELAALYGIQATPQFFLVDPQGEIVAGGAWSSELQQALGALKLPASL